MRVRPKRPCSAADEQQQALRIALRLGLGERAAARPCATASQVSHAPQRRPRSAHSSSPKYSSTNWRRHRGSTRSRPSCRSLLRSTSARRRERSRRRAAGTSRARAAPRCQPPSSRRSMPWRSRIRSAERHRRRVRLARQHASAQPVLEPSLAGAELGPVAQQLPQRRAGPRPTGYDASIRNSCSRTSPWLNSSTQRVGLPSRPPRPASW